MTSPHLRWPLVIGVSGALLAVLVIAGVHTPLRVVLALWFLLVCTGMAFVPLLHVERPLTELGLGVIASIAVDTVVITAILLAGHLSATTGLLALGATSLLGCTAQVRSRASARGARMSAVSRRAARRARVSPIPSGSADATKALPAPALLNDLATAASLLLADLGRGRTLDAYLRAAGMAQVTDDYLHAEIYPLDRAVGELRGRSPALGRLAAASANAIRALRARRPSLRRVRRWRAELAGIVEVLARDVQADLAPGDVRHGSAAGCSAALVAQLAELPADLRLAVGRLPSCFHSFDQQPADLVGLIEQFAERHPERGRTLLVVGVRTSGSYLAPLCAASLRATGYGDVRVLTVRPDRALLGYERDLVRAVARRDGLVLLTDDPPVTGSSIAKAAHELERAGAPADATVLLLQVLGADAVLPPLLRDREAVVLPASRWAVDAKLRPPEVRSVLSQLVGAGTSVLAAEPARLPALPSTRGHRRALFRVALSDEASGDRAHANVLVEGVGLGFLGAHMLPRGRELQSFLPKVFGLRDGLLYREWLPDERRVGPIEDPDDRSIAPAIAAYVATRQRALPADADLSLGLIGEGPAWEVASSILSRVFGRAWPVAKVVLIDRAVKRVLRVQRPSIVDGNTDLAQWFYRDGAKRSLVKADIGENRFSNLGLSCFDAAFDLAGVTARTDSPTLARRLRDEHAEQSHERIDEERWLLYELAHLWGHERTQPGSESELRRARSRALQRYFADVYFADVAVQPDGPLCALDIDGVLETEQLGFPALTPAAALALRALALHGFRPVLATGRSLEEVISRCRSYPLAGAVAEYGSATYECRSGTIVGLVPDETAAVLQRLRALLEQTDGVHVEQHYRHSVRAFAVQRGHRSGLRREVIDEALMRAEADGVCAIQGEGQTDFIASAVDKGTGVRALLAQLDEPPPPHDERPLALAVGDTSADVSLAALAARALAPAHAPKTLRKAGFELTSKPYQAGLAQAVGKLIGHTPGSCDVCRMPRPSAERRIVLTLLATPESGRFGMALHALNLAGIVARTHS